LTERIITDSNGRKHITTEPLRPRLDQGPDYERGFVDGMMHLTQTSVYKAVNAIAQQAIEALAQPAQGWKLREVYFDEHGEPIMHREPAQEKNT